MNFRSALLAAALFSTAIGAHAQTTVSWDEITTGNWSDTTQWLSGQAPATGDIVTFQGLANGTSVVDETIAIAGLETNFLLLGPLTISSSGGNVISLQSGATISQGSSFALNLFVPIQGAGNLWLNGGTGTVTLNPGTGSNTFSGSTEVFGGGTLSDGEDNSYSPNSLMYIGGTGGGTLNVNFNETIAGLNDGGTNGIVSIASGKTLTLNSGFTTTFSGVIQGSGNLEKDGSSTLSLAGANTYTGTTVIGTGASIWLTGTAGSLASSSISGAGGISFNDTGTYTYSGNITGSLGVAENGGASAVNTLSGNNTYTGATSVLSGTLQAGSTTAFGNVSNVEIAAGATLDLNGFSNKIGYLSNTFSTSAITLGAGTLTFGTSPNYSTFQGVISGTGRIVVNDSDGYYLLLNNANIYSGGTSIVNGTVLLENTSGSGVGSGAVTISSNGVLQIGSVNATGLIGSQAITDNGDFSVARTDSTSYSNAIGGTGAIGVYDGTVTLSGNNTYSGETSVTNGTLVAGSTSAFGGATGLSSVSLSGSTFDLSTFSNTVGSIFSDPTSVVNMDTGAVLTIGGTSRISSISGMVTGAGSLVMNGSLSTATLSNANIYSGGTTVMTGSLVADNASGSATGTGGIMIDLGGTLDIGAGDTNGSVSTPTITDNGSIEFDRTDSSTFSSTISGTGGVSVVGPGSVTLTGANSYTGSTVITDAGTLADGAPNAFSQGSSVSVYPGTTLAVGFNETVASLTAIGSAGSVTLAPGATLTSLGAGYDGSDFAGTLSGSGAFAVSTGVQGLSGNNTFSGGTTITGDGELFVGSNTAVGTGTLTFNGTNTELSPDANVTLANPVVLDSTFDNDDGGTNNLTLTGIISGVAEIEWCAWGTLSLTNSNTFTGGIDMREGTLLLGSNTAAGIGGSIILDTGTILAAYGGPGASVTVPNDLNITGSSAQFGDNDNNNLTLSGTFGGESSLTYEGGSSGTLTITGANNGYSGPFTIESGTVIAGNNFAFGSSGNSVSLTGGAGLNVQNGVTVNNPLTTTGSANVLSGNGTIGSAVLADSAVVISPSASPGGGPGNLTFSSGLTLASGGAIHFDLYDATGSAGTGFSLITATGGLDLTASANTITFNVISTNSAGGSANALNFNPANPYSWTFANSSSAITGFSAGQFHLVTGGFLNATGGGTFSVSEVGDSLDLNFTPVPEPGTWAMIAAGLGLLGALGWKRRRAAA